MNIIRIYEKSYEIIEFFEFHILVQEVGTGIISLIEYQQVNSSPVQNVEEDSNIISLKGFARWQRRVKKRKAI